MTIMPQNIWPVSLSHCTAEKSLRLKTLLVTCVFLALMLIFVQKSGAASIGEVLQGLHPYEAQVLGYLYCKSFLVQIGLVGMLYRTGVVFRCGKTVT